MSNRTRILVSTILVMASGMFCTAAVTMAILYKLELKEQRDHLMEIARGQAHFMEAVARFDAIRSQDDYPGGARAATLSQIAAAHEHYSGFGETGELVVAQREGDRIVFLFPYRHGDGSDPDPIPWRSELAEPMRRALSGQEGTLVGLDYRGERVVAAYHPVAVLNLGVVAKIDLAELRAPFVMAALTAGGVTVFLVLGGAGLTLRVTDPLVRRLQESEAWLSTTLKSIGDAVIATDMQGSVRFMNPVAEVLTGWKQDDAIGKPLTEVFVIINERTGQRAENPITRVLAEGVIVGLANHTALISKDGTKRVIDDSGAPLKDVEGHVSGAVLTFRDVTERRRAEEERMRLATAINGAVEAVVITDLEGTVQYVNPAFERITGYSRQEAVGQNMRLIKSGKHDQAFYQQLWGRIKRGQVWSGQFVNKRKDGTLYDEEGTISPVRDENGKIINFVAVKYDVTDRRRAEEAVRAAQERLLEQQRREKEHVETELEKARGHLVRHTRLATIGQVSASVAHELRNPLGAVRNAAYLLRRHVPQNEEKWAQYLGIIDEEVNRADRTIRNLMEMSRSKEPTMQQVDLGDIVRESLALADSSTPSCRP
ncbi:MAG: PAS domain S-box protein [Phycisphaerae bacterium]